MQQPVVLCDSEVITENDDSQDPDCEEFHDVLLMSRWHEPTVKTLIHRGFTTSELAGCDSKTLRVWCPRAAATGSSMNKAGKTPLVSQTGQSNSAELVEKCPPTTRHKVRNAVTTAEGKSPKLQTTADQGQKVYKLTGLEALGNEASPRERCPRGQRRRCLAQDSAGMDGLTIQKRPGK